MRCDSSRWRGVNTGVEMTDSLTSTVHVCRVDLDRADIRGADFLCNVCIIVIYS